MTEFFQQLSFDFFLIQKTNSLNKNIFSDIKKLQSKNKKTLDIPPLCPCMVAAIASRSTSKSEPEPPAGTPTFLIELTEVLCRDSPDPKNII